MIGPGCMTMGSMGSFPISSSNHSASSPSFSRPSYGYLILMCIPLVTVFGNALVILAVMGDKKLKVSVTNRYTAALAFSDLLVGLVPMPFAVYVKVNRDLWYLDVVWCRLYVAFDVASSTASILHLVLISCDRYLAIMWPHEYQRYAKRAKVSFPVVLVWMISFTICIPVVMGKSILNTNACWLENPEYMLYSSLLSFYIPAGVMTLMYLKIFRKLNRLKTIRSMLRAGGTGSDTTGPFGLLPVVLVQEVSYPRLVSNREERSLDSDPRACSNAVACATERITRKNGSPHEPHERRPVRKSGIDQVSYEDRFHSSRNRYWSMNRIIENDETSTLLPKIGIDEKRRGFKRSISALHPRPCFASTRRLSLWFGRDPSSDGQAFSNIDSHPVIDRYDSKVWAVEIIDEERLFNKLGKTDTEKENGQVYAAPLTVTPSNSGGALKKLATRLTSALQRKTDKHVFVKEKRATKMVAIILGVFIICWLPFFTFNSIRGICLSITDSSSNCDWLPADLFFLTTWLGYANSGINPIIYGLVNEQFRATYKRLLRWPAKSLTHWNPSQSV